MRDRLEDLAAVTGMMLDTELAKLREVSHEVARLEAEVAALLNARDDRARNADHGEADLARMSGQDAKWQAWVQVELARRRVDVANAMARREAQRLAARTAFGRVEALKSIRAGQQAARRQAAVRRSRDETG